MKAGRKFRDIQGRVWTVESDGLLTLEDGAEEAWMFSAVEGRYGPVEEVHDPVNHPRHYTGHPSGIECIQVTEHMNFNLGNATKYLWRAGEKGDAVEDLRKSVWYIEREIARLGAGS